MSVVKKDVMAMEESVSKAEAELSSGTLIKKLSSLVSSVRSFVVHDLVSYPLHSIILAHSTVLLFTACFILSAIQNFDVQ